MQNRDPQNRNLGNQGNLGREEIGRKGGTMGGTTTQREGMGQNVKEGWQTFKGRIRQKWNQLTDKDLDTYQNRDRGAFVDYVHGRVGGDRTGIERDIDTYARETNYRW